MASEYVTPWRPESRQFQLGLRRSVDGGRKLVLRPLVHDRLETVCHQITDYLTTYGESQDNISSNEGPCFLPCLTLRESIEQTGLEYKCKHKYDRRPNRTPKPESMAAFQLVIREFLFRYYGQALGGRGPLRPLPVFTWPLLLFLTAYAALIAFVVFG
jgi:hypothetical protein